MTFAPLPRGTGYSESNALHFSYAWYLSNVRLKKRSLEAGWGYSIAREHF